MAITTENVKYQPEYNPQAIISYCLTDVKPGRSKNQDVIMKAKKHLSALGWSFFFIYKNQDRRELRYRSPAGRMYYSLRTACKSIVDHHAGCYNNVVVDHVLEVDSSKFRNPKDNDTKPGGSYDCLSDNRTNESVLEISCFMEEKSKESETKLERKYDCLSDNRPQKRIRIEDVENSYFRQGNQLSEVDEKGIFEGVMVQDDETTTMRSLSGKNIKDYKPMKRIRKGEKGSSTRRRCILSLLIEKNIVSSGERVSYCKKDGRILAKGRAYDEGIRCDCCDQLFLLSKFEAHAGSTYHRPAANIFLEDGRSIFDCQTQLQLENSLSTATKSPKSSDKSSKTTDNVTNNEPNDDYCSFCYDGGELVLCDSCTSSYHSTCIGLKEIPNSDYWFCPSCRCRICHQGNNGPQITCEQCDRPFHVDCVTRLGFSVSKDPKSDTWLCSESCERIFAALKSISGASIQIAEDNLSWRLLKLDEHGNNKTETHSRLNNALDVMHECFERIKHRWSNNDLVEDLIFSRCSNGSNLKGFFTAVLERDDETITVATMRVRGCKVVEIPLIATRFRYRRSGMCRILLDEIERKLGELGIERLVLPAVQETMSTWTKSFGFSVMTEAERLNLVEYNFLDFPGTIWCQKILK
ncbi:hypothetical protein QVD17_17701 [Tagetes erecta]|uniref:Uncharacterized protein n=1 Tax=Tagetes erecta TaxID=13708 RepID=A0AAD8KX68_TARER|nr:hypothetical protein QVD17_17701 [Tagetes erecta]